MNLDFALLADGAVVHDAKLYVYGGGLRRIDVSQLPWEVRMSIAARFTADLDEAGDEHEFSVRIVAPDGRSAALPSITIALQPRDNIPEDWEDLSAYALADLGINFASAWWYRFAVSLDAEPLVELRLRIVHAPDSGWQLVEPRAPQGEP